MKMYRDVVDKDKARKNFEKYVELEQDEKWSLFCDDTILGSGKEGAVLTDTRVIRFQKDDLQSYPFTSLSAVSPLMVGGDQTNGISVTTLDGETTEFILGGIDSEDLDEFVQAAQEQLPTGGAVKSNPDIPSPVVTEDEQSKHVARSASKKKGGQTTPPSGPVGPDHPNMKAIQDIEALGVTHAHKPSGKTTPASFGSVPVGGILGLVLGLGVAWLAHTLGQWLFFAVYGWAQSQDHTITKGLISLFSLFIGFLWFLCPPLIFGGATGAGAGLGGKLTKNRNTTLPAVASTALVVVTLTAILFFGGAYALLSELSIGYKALAVILALIAIGAAPAAALGVVASFPFCEDCEVYMKKMTPGVRFEIASYTGVAEAISTFDLEALNSVPRTPNEHNSIRLEVDACPECGNGFATAQAKVTVEGEARNMAGAKQKQRESKEAMVVSVAAKRDFLETLPH